MKPLTFLSLILLIAPSCKSSSIKRYEIDDLRFCIRDFYLVPVTNDGHPHVEAADATHLVYLEDPIWCKVGKIHLTTGDEIIYRQKIILQSFPSGEWTLYVGELQASEKVRFCYSKMVGDGKLEKPW